MTKARCYHNKGHENVRVPKVSLEGYRNEQFSVFFLSQNSFQTCSNEGNRGQGERETKKKSSLNIH